MSHEKALYDELYRRLRSIYPAFFDDCEIWVEAGWVPIVAASLAELRRLRDETGTEARGRQIKEKFGELRFYWKVLRDNESEARSNLVSDNIDIRELSKQTCEVCGKQGELRQDKYSAWVTVCEKHINNRITNKEELAELIEITSTATLRELANRVDYTPTPTRAGPGLYNLERKRD